MIEVMSDVTCDPLMSCRVVANISLPCTSVFNSGRRIQYFVWIVLLAQPFLDLLVTLQNQLFSHIMWMRFFFSSGSNKGCFCHMDLTIYHKTVSKLDNFIVELWSNAS